MSVLDDHYENKLEAINKILRRHNVLFRLHKALSDHPITGAQLMLLETLKIQLEDAFADA